MDNTGQNIPVSIAYIGGGSLNWAANLMADLAFDSCLAADVRLYDIDIDAAKRNAQIGMRFAAVSNGVPAKYTVSETLAEALKGADIVIISILPGSFEYMAADIEIPAKYGIPQAVGDTVGPGGLVRAMRAIPMMLEFGRAIRDHAPTASVCNLTNPMSVLTGALYAAFPEIRAWGECHEVTKIRRQIAWIANQKSEVSPYDFRDVNVNVLGINHFTFVDSMSLDGVDMMPAYKEFIAAHANSGWAQVEPGKNQEHARYFGTKNLVAFDLYNRFGVPAAAGDRHLAEFMLVGDYLADPEKWGFALTPVEYRVRHNAERREYLTAMADGEIAPIPARSDEALIEQITALMGGEPFIANVNLPNSGQIDGLPLGAIVESNAVFSGHGITPMISGMLPAQLNKIVSDHSSRQSQLLTAVMEGDQEGLFEVFSSDPLVSSLDASECRNLYMEMLDASRFLLSVDFGGGI